MKNGIISGIRHILGVRMFPVVLVILSLTFLSSLEKLLGAYSTPFLLQNSYHVDILLEALSYDTVSCFVPILAVLPFAGSYVDDIKTKFARFFLIRTNCSTYLVDRILVYFLSGGIVIIIGTLPAWGVSALLFLPMEKVAEASSEASAILLKTCVLLFLSGGLWAVKDSCSNLFTVAFFTGMRQGELLGLSWENVDFKNGVIYVKQQLQCKDGEYFFCTPKSGKGRTIAPASVVMDALHQQWRDQRIASMEAGEAWSNPNNLVFTDPLGKNLVRRTVVKHFKSVAQRVGIPDARFHDLRHSFAVTSLQAGDDIKTVQENLGHATAAFTLDVYGHVSEKMRRDSATRMQLFYESIRETKSGA